MKVLVTGATGFLGGWTARALKARGDTVRVLGRNATALAGLEAEGMEPVQSDLRNARQVFDACRGMDAVVHAGAMCAPWGRLIDFHDVNVGGTSIVLSGCREHGVGRMIHISSPSVVFNGGDQEGIREDAPYPRRFASSYAETKKLAEDVVNAGIAIGFPAVILRPRLLFGPGDGTLVPRLIAAARAGRLKRIGDGTNRTDPTYVENAVHAILLALDADRALGRTYTITNGKSVHLWALVGMVLEHAGLTEKLPSIPLSLALRLARALEWQAWFTRREPVLTRYSVQMLARTQTYDISRASEELGYSPVVSLDEGIRRTVEAWKQ